MLKSPANFDVQPTLVGDLVSARPLHRSDFEALYEVAADPLIWEQHPAKDRWKREVFSRLFESLMDGGGCLVIVDNANGAVIGSSSYYDFHEAERDIAIGYTFLARRYWGGSYNAELKALMLDHAFRYVDRVWFHVGTENWRSQRAMEKVGARLSHRAERDIGGVSSVFLHYVIERP
jgi:RimJ/RimL family protein N-acetyltransferase